MELRDILEETGSRFKELKFLKKNDFSAGMFELEYVHRCVVT